MTVSVNLLWHSIIIDDYAVIGPQRKRFNSTGPQVVVAEHPVVSHQCGQTRKLKYTRLNAKKSDTL